jgi:hypothetical protein
MDWLVGRPVRRRPWPDLSWITLATKTMDRTKKPLAVLICQGLKR